VTQKNMEISHSRVDDSLLAPLGHFQCEASFKRPDHPREGGERERPSFSAGCRSPSKRWKAVNGDHYTLQVQFHLPGDH